MNTIESLIAEAEALQAAGKSAEAAALFAEADALIELEEVDVGLGPDVVCASAVEVSAAQDDDVVYAQVYAQ
jgi:hypothetical protein